MLAPEALDKLEIIAYVVVGQRRHLIVRKRTGSYEPDVIPIYIGFQ